MSKHLDRIFPSDPFVLALSYPILTYVKEESFSTWNRIQNYRPVISRMLLLMMMKRVW